MDDRFSSTSVTLFFALSHVAALSLTTSIFSLVSPIRFETSSNLCLVSSICFFLFFGLLGKYFHCFHHLTGSGKQCINNLFNGNSRILGLVCQLLNLICDNGKSFTGFSCTGSFNACIQTPEDWSVKQSV